MYMSQRIDMKENYQTIEFHYRQQFKTKVTHSNTQFNRD